VLNSPQRLAELHAKTAEDFDGAQGISPQQWLRNHAHTDKRDTGRKQFSPLWVEIQLGIYRQYLQQKASKA
jgi:hypothetical protein